MVIYTQEKDSYVELWKQTTEELENTHRSEMVSFYVHTYMEEGQRRIVVVHCCEESDRWGREGGKGIVQDEGDCSEDRGAEGNDCEGL